MKRIGELVAKYKIAILIVSVILLIPALINYKNTNINYDILVYLPSNIETVKGEKILTEDFGLGAYSISVIDNMKPKDVIKLEKKIKEIPGVSNVGSIYDVIGTTIPKEMLPDEVKDKLYDKDSTILFVTFDGATSEKSTLKAVSELQKLADGINIGGMSAIVLDTKNLSDKEMLTYIIVAVILCLIVLTISLDNYIVPILLLLNIGVAIVYNMGTNIFFGEISYITKAISAVLQLGVTTDFSIFLYHKYSELKGKYKDKNKAMIDAITETMKSVTGSSLTTIAGFLALCTMSLTLGKDIGLVMAKGVVFGVFCVLTVFPAILLTFDKRLSKFDHKPILPNFDKINYFIVKHYKKLFVLFSIILIPAYIANTKTEVYYNLEDSLPKTLGSIKSEKELEEKFGIVSPEIILVDSKLTNDETESLVDEIKTIDGIDFVISYNDLEKMGIDIDMLDSKISTKVKSDKYKLLLANSIYENATDELNNQIDIVNKVVKKYDKKAIVAGNGALTKDLVKTSATDFNNVSIASIGVVFLLMFIVLESVSLPVILILTIELAIFINMGIPYIFHQRIPFIASIVLGTIQLGATIDYAILMTTKYLDKRKNGMGKMDSVLYAVNNSSQSIFTSALCFFSATFGVGIYSKLEMIGSLCMMMARGSIISMLIVLFILPSLLIVLDKLIIKTTKGFKKGDKIKMKNKLALLAASILLAVPLNAYALTKNETVYVKMNNEGKQNYYSVREHLINEEKTDNIKVKTGLSNIANLNGNEKFSLDNSNLIWAAKGKDIYYEGTTEEKLPIGLDISYKLDGKTVNPNDIKGKKGNIETTLHFYNYEKHEDVYTPFVIGLTTKLGEETRNIKVTNGTISNNGNNTLVAAISSPGLAESLDVNELSKLDEITISYETQGFKIPSYYLLVTPKLLEKADLSMLDNMDSIYSDISTLGSASKEIKNGARKLKDGTNEFASGMKEYNNAMKEIKSYSNLMNDSYTQINDGVGALNDAIENIESFVNMFDDINIDKEKYIESLTIVKQIITSLLEDVNDITLNYDSHIANLREIASKIEDEEIRNELLLEIDKLDTDESLEKIKNIDEKLVKIDKRVDMLLDNADLIVDNVNNLHNNIKLLSDSTQQLKDGSNQFKEGFNEFNGGINKATSASNTLYGASIQIKDGANTLSEGIDKFDTEGINKLVNIVNSQVKTKVKKTQKLINLSKNYQTYIDNEDKNVQTTSTIIILINSSK